MSGAAANPGAATQVVLLRHGQTDWNVAGRMQGHEDIPLNAEGLAQAQALANELAAQARAGRRLGAVISSDLSRAQQTAKALADACGLPLTVDAALRERHYGAWQGYTMAEVAQRWPADAAAWKQRLPHAAPQRGESLAVFAERCLAALLRHATAHAGQRIAIVAHGGVLDALYRAAHALPLDAPRNWPLPNAAINVLHVQGGVLRVDAWGHVAHLRPTGSDDDETAGS